MPPQQREQEDKQEKKKGKKKWLLIILIVTLLAGGSVGGYFLVGQDNFRALFASAGEEKVISVTLDTFTVNLADMQYRRYLRTDITLECYSKGAIEEIETKKHRIRDRIITILNQKTVNDFDSKEKFERVRVELLKAVNDVLSPENQIKALYFENFIIQ